MERACTKCGEVKPFSEFVKNKSKKDGINSWCKQCQKVESAKYYLGNKDKYRIYASENKEAIRKRMREYGVKYREEHADEIKNKKKAYYENHYKVARRDKIAAYARKRRQEGLICKIDRNMSLAIWRSLVYEKNGAKWESLVGYSLEQLKTHLEKQFAPGMSWDNYGKTGWEIDHRIPLSIFNIHGANSKGFKKAWALNNLQPLWQRENSSKGNKLFIR